MRCCRTTDPFDVFLENGRIADIAPSGALPPRGEVLDADGAWLSPGLWDHHVHVVQWALVARAPHRHANSAAHAAPLMGAAPSSDGRRVGTGFRDALWSDVPSWRPRCRDRRHPDLSHQRRRAQRVAQQGGAAAGGAEPDGVGILREAPAFEISRSSTRSTRRSATASSPAWRCRPRPGLVGLVDLDMAWNDPPGLVG